MSTEYWADKELLRWSKSEEASRTEQPKVEQKAPTVLTTRQRYMAATAILANKTSSPPLELVSEFTTSEDYLRWGEHKINEDQRLQAVIYYLEGPPSHDADGDALPPIETPGSTLTYLNDLIDLPEKQEDEEEEFPIAYELRVMEYMDPDNEDGTLPIPQLVHSVSITDVEADSVYMDLNDTADWSFTEEDSTQEERDAILNYFMIRFYIKDLISHLDDSERGPLEVAPIRVIEESAEIKAMNERIAAHPRLF